MTLQTNGDVAARSDWGTPWDVYNRIIEHVGITPVVDICAKKDTAKCSVYCGPDHEDENRYDGLNHDMWTDTNWQNPPYGRALDDWLPLTIRMARERAITTVALLPSSSWDAEWMHQYVLNQPVMIYPVRGRICFVADGVQMTSPGGGNIVVVYGWRSRDASTPLLGSAIDVRDLKPGKPLKRAA